MESKITCYWCHAKGKSDDEGTKCPTKNCRGTFKRTDYKEIDCPYCNKKLWAEMDGEYLYDIYLKENEKDHDMHLDYASHQLDLNCQTCECDEPTHCTYALEGMYDRAKEMRKYGD